MVTAPVERNDTALPSDCFGPRRVVYFHFGGRFGNGYLFRSHGCRGLYQFSDRFRLNEESGFVLPPFLAAAFEAGEPIEPILDWLIEHHAHSHPWLPAAVTRVCGQGGVPC